MKLSRHPNVNFMTLVFGLTVASGTDDWYKPVKGIGPKTAQDLLGKLDRLFISRLEHAGDDDYDER